MWDFLDQFDWLTALDRADIEEAWTAHGPPLKTNEGDWWYAYASDADARAGVLAIREDVAGVLQRHGERDPREVMDAARHIHDKVIATVDRCRPRDTWSTRSAFAAAIKEALAEPPGSGVADTTPDRPVFAERAEWLRTLLKTHGLSLTKLDEVFRGPTRKTLARILKGEFSEEETLTSLVEALNRAGVTIAGRPVTRADIPNN